MNARAARWTDAFLDEMRQQGDPPADAVITDLFEHEDVARVQELLGQLMANADRDPAGLPAPVKKYFDTTGQVDPAELPEAGLGERFFATHGPEIMLVLCAYSLPVDYANHRAVGVLYQTGFLAKRPNRRVAETAQMIVDVMTPGGLGPDGLGIRSAQKVRLMHASIRHLILRDEQLAWNVEELGIPINQADLAYTLMSFTHVVLEGLKKLDLEVVPEQAQAYLDAWRVVGRIMGIHPELIPHTLDEAAQLAEITQRRQMGPSMEGRVMTEAIIGVIQDVLGKSLEAYASSLVRFFVGARVADMLGVRRQFLRDRIVHVVAWLAALLDGLVERKADRRRFFRKLSLDLIQHFIDRELGPDTREFRIPTHLHDDWKP